jgi:hypothetical protein
MTRITKIVFSSLLSIFFLHLWSCNEQPSQIAVNLLPDTAAVKGISSLDTQIIVSQRVYKADFPLFNYGAVLIGKADGMTAAFISNFAFIPDTLDYLKVEDIELFQITMYPHRYTYGDSISGYFGFDIYKVNRRWNRDTTNYDSLFKSPANYYDPIPIASWSGKIPRGDSLGTVQIDLPKELLIDWLRTETVFDPDSGKNVTRRIPNWGIIFVPHAQCNVIHRFHGNQPSPNAISSIIKVDYKDKNDSLRSFNMISGIDMTFLEVPKPDTNFIVIHNGINYWTELQFDLSMIPRFSGIHKSQLILHIVEDSTKIGNIKFDSTVIEANFFMNDYLNPIFQFLGANMTQRTQFLFPSFSSAIQYWNRTTGKGSLILMPHSINAQARQLDRYYFYGINHPDISKRPVLKVIYTTNPSQYE